MTSPSRQAATEWIHHNMNLVVAAFGDAVDWSKEGPEVIAAATELEDEIENFFYAQTGSSDRLREKWRSYYRSMLREK